MAKIIYSLAQEGRGHASRACEIIKRLIAEGHKVTALTGGDAYNPLKEAFLDEPNFSIIKIPGFRLYYDALGRVDYTRSLSSNAGKFLNSKKTISHIERLIKKHKFDLAISDFEPFLPRAAQNLGCDFITIDNQHRLVFEKQDLSVIKGKHALSYLVTKSIIKEMHPLGSSCIITSSFKPVIEKKFLASNTEVFVFGPIIRSEIEALKKRIRRDDFVLVYVKKPLENAVIPKISSLPVKFVMYVRNPADYQTEKISNVTYKKHSAQEFANDFSKCKAVISSAGEQLISEALYLGKPLFLFPEEGTFEQTLNAMLVKKYKVGAYQDISKIEPHKIMLFLNRLSYYEKNIKLLKIENGVNKSVAIILKQLEKNKEA